MERFRSSFLNSLSGVKRTPIAFARNFTDPDGAAQAAAALDAEARRLVPWLRRQKNSMDRLLFLGLDVRLASRQAEH